MRRITVVGLAGAAVATLSVLAPVTANAAPGDTGVTFTLTGGSLSLTTPTATANLTSGGALSLSLAGGQSVSGQLGATTVSDLRGLATHVDTVTMSTTDFSDGAATPDVIAKSNATAYSGAATGTTGIAVTVPTTSALPASIGNTGGATVFQMTGVVGQATATYNPTVTVNIPAGAVAATYTGTVTQTVA